MTARHKVLNALATAVLAAVLSVGLVSALALTAGWRAVVITTASMGQTAPPGTLIAASPIGPEAVDIGDLLVMRRAGDVTVTHRVVDIDVVNGSRVATTRGDANAAADATPYPLIGEQLVRRWQMPHLGSLLLWARNGFFVFGLVALAVTAMSFLTIRHIWGGPTNGSPRRPRPADPASWGRVRSPKRRSRSKAVIGTALAVSLLATGGSATALFTNVESVSANTFAVSSCFEASLASVQTGQTSLTSSGTFDIAVTPVEVAASFLMFSSSSSSGDPADAVVLGELLDTSTIRFVRDTDVPGPTVFVNWSLVSYTCGVSVQRGSIVGNELADADITISTVNPSTSFVVMSALGPATGTEFDGTYQVSAQLTSATNLRLHGLPTLPSTHTYAWQVISFDDTTDASVEVVTTTLTPGQSTGIVALGGPVDESRTLLLSSVTSAETGPDVGERLVRVHLSSDSTVEVSRQVSTGAVDVVVQVITLTDGTYVQHGTVDFAPTELAVTIPVDLMDPNRSTVISTVQSTGSQSLGSTTMILDDVVGEAMARFEITTPDRILLTRDVSTAAASFGWQLIEWSGPPWWDPDSPVRHRIDVAADTEGAPAGYTIPVTFDHSAMVASGLSSPTGADIRILRWNGLSWTELDRILEDGSGWSQNNTTILFATSDSIIASETATYWMYTGDAAPDPALENPENVFLLYETFESGTLGDFVDRTGSTSWYQADPWARTIELTISSALVSADQTGLRVLVQLTSPDLATWSQPDGSDIRFTASDTTPLTHEIEFYDSASGSLTAWVKVPMISGTTDTTVFMHYGSADSPSQQDPASTFDDHLAVWHLDRDPSGQAPHADDSTSFSVDGLAVGAMTSSDLVPSLIGKGLDFDGIDDRIELATPNEPGRGLTLSTWFKADTFGTDPRLVSKAASNAETILELAIDDTSTTTGLLRARVRIESVVTELVAGAVTTGTWTHAAVTYDGAVVRLFLDGVEVATEARTGSIDAASDMAMTIGALPDGAGSFDGLIDEVRLAPSAITQSRLDTLVTNQANPALFISPSVPVSNPTFAVGPWLARKPIAISAEVVPATQTDYPLLVQITDNDLQIASESDGSDIVFTDSDGVTRLDHEIESWDSTTGELTAWVRIPLLSDTVNTEIFIYYDNGSAVDQQDPSGVFGDPFDAVYHLRPTL